MTSLELLKEIEAWLSFNTEPSKEETAKLRKSINKHVSEQLRQHFVSRCNADSDKLVECSNCGDIVEMISSGEFCPHCFC